MAVALSTFAVSFVRTSLEIMARFLGRCAFGPQPPTHPSISHPHTTLFPCCFWGEWARAASTETRKGLTPSTNPATQNNNPEKLNNNWTVCWVWNYRLQPPSHPSIPHPTKHDSLVILGPSGHEPLCIDGNVEGSESTHQPSATEQ